MELIRNIRKISSVAICAAICFLNTSAGAGNMLGIVQNGGQVSISGSLDAAKELISLRFYNASDSLVAIDTGKTNETGEYSFDIRLPEDAESGTYRAAVVSESGVGISEEAYIDNSKPEEYNLYVSTDGNDENDGTKSAPLMSIAAARNKIRELKKTHNYVYTVHIAAGGYYLSEPIEFLAKDSGSEQYPVTYKAEGAVNIKGSRKIDSTHFVLSENENIPESARGKVYEADVSDIVTETVTYPTYGALGSGTSYLELTSGGEILELAKYPNSGFIYSGTAGADGKSFAIDAADMDSVLFKGYWGNYWSMQTIEGSIESKTAHLTEVPTYTLKNDREYYIFNNIALLDSPGEWYLDNDEKKLYYYPIAGESFDDIEISVMTDALIDINGADNVIFDGINAENTRGDGYFVHGSAENITIKNSQIKNIGNAAVRINSGFGIVVDACNITSIGGVGVHDNGGNRYTLTESGNTVRGCDISNFGRIYRSYAAGVNIIGTGAEVKDNIIHDAPHFAVRFDGNNNLITNNEIYNCCLHTRDAGAIYGGRDWLGFGNEISYNYIHDITSTIVKAGKKVDDVHAIYLDDMQSGTNVHNNTIVRCARGVFVAGGSHNEVYNNVVTDCGYGFLADSRGTLGNTQYDETLSGGKVRAEYDKIVKNESFDDAAWKAAYSNFEEVCVRVESDLGGVPTGNKIYSNIFSGNTDSEDYIKYTAEFASAVYDNYLSVQSDVGFADYEHDDFRIIGDVPEYVSGCRNNGNLSERTLCTAEIFDGGEVVIRNRTDKNASIDIWSAVMSGKNLIECKKQSLDASGNEYISVKSDMPAHNAGEIGKIFVWSGMRALSTAKEY